MDPVTTTLVSAFVVGAAKGGARVGESAVVDAYTALKSLIIASYGKAVGLIASIKSIEEKPNSYGRRQMLAEELKEAGALDDEALVVAADEVLKAAEKSGQAIGVDWEDIRAARLSIGKIRAQANAIGFKAARMEISGEVTIEEIIVGEPSGNGVS